MPLGPRLKPGSHTANKQFTDRIAFIAAFDGALQRLDPKDETAYHVLVYYGVGGIGKTALRRHLGQRLDTVTDVCWAVVDFEAPANREPGSALFLMRNELKRKYRFRFPLFDLAYALYWEQTHPQTPLAQADIPGLEEGDLLLDLLLAVEDVPGLGLLTKIPKAVAKIGGKAMDWWRGRENELRLFAGLEPQQMLEHLSMFWALDLQRALATTGEQVVLFLDTYEALWQGKRVDHLRFSVDQWVRDWVLQLPQVLWVIGGRERIAWAELDPDWDEALDQHLIGALANEDARRFLQAAGVDEPELQDVILEGAQGVPFYLDLAVDTHMQLRARGQRPSAADFARTPREVLDRFLRYLDRSERETLNVLSAARIWDRTMFERLISVFQTGYPPTALRELCRFSFVEDVQGEARDTDPAWTMHALMREGLQAYGDPALIARVHHFLYEHYDAMLQVLDSKVLTEAQQQAFGEAFFHGRQVLDKDAFIAWYGRTKEAFQQAARWRFLIPLQEQMTAFMEEVYEAGSEQLAEALHDLGDLYDNQGRYGEAEPLYLRALSLRERVLGGEHPEVASTLNNLVLVYRNQGRYDKAEPLQLRALAIVEKMLEEEHPYTAIALSNLAGLYVDQGRYDEAEPLYGRALSIEKRVRGAVHPALASTLNNLALLYHHQGRYDEAESCYQRAHSIWEQAFGTQHPDVALSLNNLATVYDYQGRKDEAEPLYRQAIALREQLLGPEHPDVAQSLSNLASMYYEQGRYDEAIPLFQRALSIREQGLGEKHPEVASSLNNLATAYRSQGRYDEAEPLYRRACAIREQLHGPEHSNVTTVLSNLAWMYTAQERYNEAEPLFQRVLSILEKEPDKQLDVATSLASLAWIYDNQGQYEEAEPLYLRALSLRAATRENESPVNAVTLNNLAWMYTTQGRYNEAVPLYQQALSVLEKASGHEHPNTKAVRGNFQTCLNAQNPSKPDV